MIHTIVRITFPPRLYTGVQEQRNYTDLGFVFLSIEDEYTIGDKVEVINASWKRV